jgi:hypothetical protein
MKGSHQDKHWLAIFYSPVGTFPEGSYVQGSEYPDQPRSLVECCVECFRTFNCCGGINAEGLECEYRKDRMVY